MSKRQSTWDTPSLKIKHGVIRVALQGLQMYSVSVDGFNGEIPAYAVGQSSGPLGTQSTGGYTVGSRVIVALAGGFATSNLAIILGAASDAKAVVNEVPPVFSCYPQVSGVEFELKKDQATAHRAVASLYGRSQFVKNYNSGLRDALDGEWAQTNVFGSGVGVELFRSWIRGGAMSGIDALYDNTLRILGSTIETISSGGWKYDRELGSVTEVVSGRSYYVADILADEPDQLYEVDSPLANGQQSIYMSRRLDNTTTSTDDAAKTQYGRARPTLYHEYRGVDGSFIMTSASSITLQKYVGLPSLSRLKRLDNSTDGLATGEPGAAKTRPDQFPGGANFDVQPETGLTTTNALKFDDPGRSVDFRPVASASQRTARAATVAGYILNHIYSQDKAKPADKKVKVRSLASILQAAGVCLSTAQRQGIGSIAADDPEWLLDIATVGNVDLDTSDAAVNAANIAIQAAQKDVDTAQKAVDTATAQLAAATTTAARKSAQATLTSKEVLLASAQADLRTAQAKLVRAPLKLTRDPSMWQQVPEAFTLNLGPNGQSKRFFFGHAFITITDEGDIVLQNAAGSQIMLAGGNIVMTTEHDVMTVAGRNIVTAAGRDSSHRAARHYEVVSHEGRVAMRAQGELALAGGHDGSSGVVIQSFGRAQLNTATNGAAVAHSSPGLHLISHSAPLVLDANSLYGNIEVSGYIKVPELAFYSPTADIHTVIGNGIWLSNSTKTSVVHPFSSYFNVVHVIDTIAGKTFKQASTITNAQAALSGTGQYHLQMRNKLESILDSQAKATFLSSENYNIVSAESFRIPIPAWYQYYWNKSSADIALPQWTVPSTSTLSQPMPGYSKLGSMLAAVPLPTDAGQLKAITDDPAYIARKVEFKDPTAMDLANLGKGI